MISLFFVLLSSCCLMTAESMRDSVAIQAAKHEIMPIKIIQLSRSNDHTREFLKLLGSCLEISGQFKLSYIDLPEITPAVFKELREQGIALALLIETEQNAVTWRLYDTVKEEQLKGQKMAFASEPAMTAVQLANELWPALTSKTGFFGTVLAACRSEKTKRGYRPVRYIETFSPAFGTTGPFRRLLVKTKTDNFAPRWHPTKLTLFYSQHTPTNIRLMAVDERGGTRVVTSFDGQNMTPAFADDGTVVLSISARNWTHLYEYHHDGQNGRAVFARLTSSNGYYISPTFLDNDRIVCEYVNASTKARIGIFDRKKHIFTEIPVGSAHAPAVNRSGKVAYCKKQKDFLQVFVYDLASKKERQVTYSSSDKDEPTWSPCGNYIAFAAEVKNRSRIAIADIETGNEWFVSPEHESWSFPHWASADHQAFLSIR